MRRSICYTEPAMSVAGEVSTWKFFYTPAMNLPKGASLKFDLLSAGRPIDWELPQINPKEKQNLIWMILPGGKTVFAEEIEAIAPSPVAFEFVLPSEVKAGETLSICLGSPEGGAGKGNRAQTSVQRRRPFHLYVDLKGKGEYREPEIFTLDVRGSTLKNIRIIAPSMVAKNKRFDVLIRFEDVFGNLTTNAAEGTLIEVSYEHLRENLNWKLFIPETGFINLPNLYFNEPGVYRIQLKVLSTKECFFSAPIRCVTDADRMLFWGLLHGESEKVDAAENIEPCLRHFRDEKNLQFFASSPFESQEETSNEIWKSISNHITEFNEDFRFSTFLGFQWFGDEEKEGLRQLLYVKDGKPILRKKESKSNILKKIYKTHHPKELLSIPSFSMGKGVETIFHDVAPDFERVVEIYNAWGCSECTAKEGNLRPITALDSSGIQESEKGSIRKALNAGHRFGFVAGGLDDRGIYQDFYDSSQVQYSPGLTAIFAIEQTREALFQGLYNRCCYATTGDKIVLSFGVAGALMGQELSTKVKPGLQFNRHITCHVSGTAPIKEVALIRNGITCHTVHPKALQIDFTFDDVELLSKIALPGPEGRPPFVYYYLRVVQENGQIAWGSPIWIDLVEDGGVTVAAKKPVKKTKG